MGGAGGRGRDVRRASTGFDGIAAPTLVLHGHERRVVDPRNADLLARADPGRAASSSSPGCGHLFFWEEPERFVEVVEEFLL